MVFDFFISSKKILKKNMCFLIKRENKKIHSFCCNIERRRRGNVFALSQVQKIFGQSTSHNTPIHRFQILLVEGGCYGRNLPVILIFETGIKNCCHRKSFLLPRLLVFFQECFLVQGIGILSNISKNVFFYSHFK
jgi:hypothetical protein